MRRRRAVGVDPFAAFDPLAEYARAVVRQRRARTLAPLGYAALLLAAGVFAGR